MNLRKLVFVVAFIFVTMVPFPVQATPVPSGSVVTGSGGDSGLSGEYYRAAPNTIDNIAEARTFIDSTTPLGTFTTSAVNYGPDNDHDTIVDFLNADGGTFAGSNQNMSDAVLLMTGFIEVTAPGSIQYWLGSDDGASLTIGGVTIINNDGLHSFPGSNPFGTADFSLAGFYAVEIIYFNKEYNGGIGDAELEWRLGNKYGRLVSNLYKNVDSVPEPGTLLLLGSGLIGLVGFRRKFKK